MTRERIDLNGQDESAVSGAARRGSSARSINLVNNLKQDPDDGIDDDILQDDSLQNEDARFLRTEKRIPVRRGPMARKTASRLKGALALILPVGVTGVLAVAAYGYGVHAERFILSSSDNIEITGVRNASRPQVMEVAGADIGRSIFFVPLDERRTQIEKVPWVESATVMRLFPDRIAVHVVERTPVAFVQIGGKVHLIDAAGVVLGLPANRQARYSFPVIHGIGDTEPLSARAAAMRIYNRVMRELASADYTRQLSEVDLSDPEDVKATVNDAAGTVLIHLGSGDFLGRYKLFADHIGEWRQQFPKVQSVDMRYEGQIVVNPDGEKPGDHSVPPKAGAAGTPGNVKVGPAKQPVKNQQKSGAKGQKPKTGRQRRPTTGV